MRTMFAFLIAPALFPFAFLGWLSVPEGQAAQDIVLGTVLPLTYVAILGLGLPSHLVLRRLRETSFVGYAIWGLLIAAIAQACYLDGMVANWHLWWMSVTGEIAIGPIHVLAGQTSWLVYGAACGAVFWMIVRPDKEFAQPASQIAIQGPHRSGP
jgi:hypothetical protein